MKRKRLLNFVGICGALALCGSLGACASSQCRTAEEQAQVDRMRDEGRRVTSQMGCNKCGTQGCKGSPGCGGGHGAPPKTPDPIVIKQPCETTGLIQVPGQQLDKLYGVKVDGTLVYQDYTMDCDGNKVCYGEPKTIPVSGKTEIPLRALVGPFAIPVTLQARPGEKPCPEVKDPPKQ